MIPLLCHQTHLIVFLQWMSFVILLGETLAIGTCEILRQAKLISFVVFDNKHDSSPETRFFKNGVCFAAIGKNAYTFYFVFVGEVVRDPPSQFPYLSERQQTIVEGHWSIQLRFELSSFRPLLEVPHLQNPMADFVFIYL